MNNGRPTNLNAVQAGITRLRVKGTPSQESLYDLVNGYVTAQRTIKSRPGTRLETRQGGEDENLAGTKGLTAFNRLLWVFSHQARALFDRFRLEVVTHPEYPDTPVKEVHFAAPFVGFLYVVIEFEDTPESSGDVFHYWLERGTPWQPDTPYLANALVEPTTPTGMVFRASPSGDPAVVWTPDTPRAVGEVYSPTVYNGFEYEVVQVIGANPRSRSVEPTWPTVEGAEVIEDTDIPTAPPAAPPPVAPPSGPPPGYGGGGGFNNPGDLGLPVNIQ